jgi:ABC-type phosphate transport system substrate-binding protein
MKSVAFMSAGLAVAVTMTTGCGSGDPDQIVRVSRQNNSGTYVYFRDTVLGEEGNFKLGSIDQSGSKDVVELVSKTPNAIGYSGMGYATDDVNMLKVSRKKGEPGVAPTMESATSGTYPLARKLYVYTLGEPTGALRHYIEWIKSSEGQAVVEEIGYVPIPPEIPSGEGAPSGQVTIKAGGSDTMVNLAYAWAETYAMKFPNVDVQVSGGGSGVGIAQLTDGTIDIANSSRDMKPDERDLAEQKSGKSLIEYTVGLDALAIYVHKENPLESISIEELAAIYGEGGTIDRWSQVVGWPSESNAKK